MVAGANMIDSLNGCGWERGPIIATIATFIVTLFVDPCMYVWMNRRQLSAALSSGRVVVAFPSNETASGASGPAGELV